MNRVCWCLLLTVLCGMSQVEAEVERIGKRINAGICRNLHPDAPCRFWHHSYGAVPEAVKTLPYDNTVLRNDFWIWPASASGKLITC